VSSKKMPPGKLKTVTVIALILGVLGLTSAITGGLALLAGAEKMQSLAAMPGQTARVAAVQQEMSKAMLAVTNEWRTYNGVMAVLLLFLASALLVGAVMSLRMRERGRRILQAAFVVGIPVEVLRGVASVSMGLATSKVMSDFMPKMMQASTPAGGAPLPAGMESAVSSVATGSALAGLVLGAGWILAQIIFYVVGALYLRKPEVRAAFSA
jgi:hypothetical protein